MVLQVLEASLGNLLADHVEVVTVAASSQGSLASHREGTCKGAGMEMQPCLSPVNLLGAKPAP